MKKENLRVEHEKNLIQIQVTQDKEQLQLLTRENHELKQILEGDRINAQEKLSKQISYSKELQRMNEL